MIETLKHSHLILCTLLISFNFYFWKGLQWDVAHDVPRWRSGGGVSRPLATKGRGVSRERERGGGSGGGIHELAACSVQRRFTVLVVGAMSL